MRALHPDGPQDLDSASETSGGLVHPLGTLELRRKSTAGERMVFVKLSCPLGGALGAVGRGPMLLITLAGGQL